MSRSTMEFGVLRSHASRLAPLLFAMSLIALGFCIAVVSMFDVVTQSLCGSDQCPEAVYLSTIKSTVSTAGLRQRIAAGERGVCRSPPRLMAASEAKSLRSSLLFPSIHFLFHFSAISTVMREAFLKLRHSNLLVLDLTCTHSIDRPIDEQCLSFIAASRSALLACSFVLTTALPRTLFSLTICVPRPIPFLSPCPAVPTPCPLPRSVA